MVNTHFDHLDSHSQGELRIFSREEIGLKAREFGKVHGLPGETIIALVSHLEDQLPDREMQSPPVELKASPKNNNIS